MQVDQSPDENSDPNPKSEGDNKMEKYKQTLFSKLAEHSTNNLDKCLSQVIFIQAMFKQDLKVLVRLFDFCLDKGELKLAADILFNDVLKNFNLNQSNVFDKHLNKFCLMIIKNSSIQKSAVTQRMIEQLDYQDQTFYKIFQSLDPGLQELLVLKILDKYRHSFNKYVKLFIESDKKSAPVAPCQQQIELKEFYLNFSRTYQFVYLIKDILFIYKKYAQEYGLYLIDTFLNVEKQMHTFLVQNATQLKLESSLISIEKRSLNLIRRFCVLDLIQDFSFLIDKLDNRHCYRWIEKCLEFFTKYSINSTKVSIESNMLDKTDSIEIFYSSIKLLHDQEILVNDLTESDEKVKHETIEEIKTSLKCLIEYEFVPGGKESTPYSIVYKLLDQIGKKLDWPTIPEAHESIQDKMAFLFSLKQKPDKQISISALNKQISFYGLTFFFNKLTEFQALNNFLFNDQLVLLPAYKTDNQCTRLSCVNISLEKCVSNLVYSIKIWQKFNQHKEYYTIVTKCLSNSKLDSLNCYKIFLADYYTSFQLGTNQIGQNSSYNWTNLANLSLKQKIPVVSYLFLNESNSFKNFFDELTDLFKIFKTNESNAKKGAFTLVHLNDKYFYLIELNCKNFLNYVCKLIAEKLWTLIELNRLSSTALLKHDQYLAVLLVLVQLSDNSKLKEFLIKIIQSKQSLDFKQFFNFIFDASMLQNILMVINQSDKTLINDKFKLGQSDANLSEKFLQQVNYDINQNQIEDRIDEFFDAHVKTIQEIFDKMSCI